MKKLFSVCLLALLLAVVAFVAQNENVAKDQNEAAITVAQNETVPNDNQNEAGITVAENEADTTVTENEPVATSDHNERAATLSEFELGKDYALLPRPVKTADPSKIEVTEIYWYGCIHCFRLQADLEDWVPALAADVNFVRVPAVWAEVMERHAAMYYANEALGLTEQLHAAIFEQMNVANNKMTTERAILKFVESQGVDPEKYRRALNSFGVSSQVTQTKSKMGAYGVRGTPEMVVNGKYKLTATMAGSHKRMLQIADALIAQERSAMTAQQTNQN